MSAVFPAFAVARMPAVSLQPVVFPLSVTVLRSAELPVPVSAMSLAPAPVTYLMFYPVPLFLALPALFHHCYHQHSPVYCLLYPLPASVLLYPLSYSLSFSLFFSVVYYIYKLKKVQVFFEKTCTLFFIFLFFHFFCF